MKQLLYELHQLCTHNRDGSYLTRDNRKDMLTQMGEQLLSLGYWQRGGREKHVHDIGRRHANALVRLWKSQGISHDTIPNRLAALRWWAEKVNRASVMPRTNAEFGLTPRVRVAKVSKAIMVEDDCLAQVDDPYVRMSFALQRAYGLRRKESLMIKPWQADAGDYLRLQGSWTKGGRPREIIVRWPEQRAVLEAAKNLVRFKSHSLIPQDMQYHQQRNRYSYWARKLGLPPLHGLRHAFAQRLYEALAHFPCPLQGGPPRETMSPAQRQMDRDVRHRISRELGHERIAIVGMYCGL